MLSSSPTPPVELTMVSMGPVTLPLSAALREDRPQAHAPPHSESAASSLSAVVGAPVPTTPTPSSPATPPALTQIPVWDGHLH